MKIINEDINEVTIILKSGHITKISTQDKKYMEIFPNWRCSSGYIKCLRTIKTEYSTIREDLFLHRLITKVGSGFLIDHANRDKLDNRRFNLRIATVAQNNHNKNKINKSNTSKFRGVHYDSRNTKNPWVARITRDKKRFLGGYFSNEIDAALAYNKLAIEVWGDFAYINDINI